MADFYTARTMIDYSYRDAAGELHTRELLTPGQPMLQPEPERVWESSHISADLVGADWGYEAPAGNARLVLTWEALVSCPTVAELERHLRRLELELNLNRLGTLTLCEAFADGLPTLCTEWWAVLSSCKVRRLPLDDAPGLPGSWGSVSLTFRLTNPKEI